MPLDEHEKLTAYHYVYCVINECVICRSALDHNSCCLQILGEFVNIVLYKKFLEDI